ncbi:MAG: sensor histidine kinase [Nannocystales bacterium]
MPPERTRSRVRAFLGGLGLHLLIAGTLSVFMVGARWSWRDLLITMTANLAFSVCIGTITSLAFGRVLPRFALTGWRGVVVKTLAFALSVALGVELALLVLRVMSLELHGSRTIVWRFAGVVTLVVLVVSVAFDRLRAHARAVELREEQARRELLEAQLSNLRARLNPHFLFNSLNSLAGLIEEDPPAAVDALQRLCELLRHALESTEARKTPLRTELSALADYLEMERLRFGDRLRWTLEIDDELGNATVPTLLLQPMVENAVKYAVAPRRDGGSIHVRGYAQDARLHLEVTDDGPGTGETKGTQVGEKTLRERLQLEYGSGATVSAGPRAEGGYRVAVSLPHEEAIR